MLLPETVRRFLFHDDRRLVHHALGYFSTAHDPAPTTADDVWAVLDRCRGDAHAPSLRILRGFPPIETSIQRMLDTLRAERSSEVECALAWPGGPLWEVPVPVLRQIADEASPWMSAATMAHLRELLALAEMSFEAQWEALEGKSRGARTPTMAPWMRWCSSGRPT